MGSIWNMEMLLVNTGSNSGSNRDNCAHFVYVQKKDKQKKFYLYRGMNFYDKEGYELIMMAVYHEGAKEIRIYAVNDVEADRDQLICSQRKFKTSNNFRVQKLDKFGFDFENGHFAKVCIYDPPGASSQKLFTIKSRYCTRCSKTSRYYCQPDKNWQFEQDLGSFQIVSVCSDKK